MHLKYRLPLAIFATAVIALGRLHAQADDEEDDEFTTMGFFGKSPQELNVSMKLSKGPQVKFGNLGNLTNTFVRPVAGAVGRSYMDGSLSIDARRPYSPSNTRGEYSATGDLLSTAGGHYQAYSSTDHTLVGDYIAYNPGYTREWSYTNQSQAEYKPGFIAMNIFSTRTQGASLQGSRGYTGGVELSIARDLIKAKRFTFSLVAGISLNGVNSSKSGTVDSTLITYTDLYSLNGNAAPFTPFGDTPPAVRYTGPSFDATSGVDKETTVPLANLPDVEGTETPTLDGAHVKGIWKIRGAYFTLKVGPQVTAMITKNIGLSAGIGLAGTYAGTTYSADESFTVAGITDPLTGQPKPITNLFGEESTTKNTLLAGYYANIDATWDLNERTGLFAGVSLDNLGNYDQSVGGRTSKIDLNSTAGVRGGLSIKF